MYFNKTVGVSGVPWYDGLSIREKKKKLKEQNVDTRGCVTLSDLHNLLDKLKKHQSARKLNDEQDGGGKASVYTTAGASPARPHAVQSNSSASIIPPKAAQRLGLEEMLDEMGSGRTGVSAKAAKLLGMNEAPRESPKKHMLHFQSSTEKTVEWIKGKAKKLAIQKTRIRMRGGRAKGRIPKDGNASPPPPPSDSDDSDDSENGDVRRRANTLEENIKEGFLTKRALKSGRNWKRRYFALNGNGLAYFKDEFSVKPKGVIHFTAQTVVENTSEHHPFGFEIKGIEHAIVYAHSEYDRDDWVSKVNEAVSRAQEKNVNLRSQCEGWLVKRGDRWKKWRKRFFAIYGNELCYFKDPMDLYDAGKINLKKIVDAQFYLEKKTPAGWGFPFKLFEIGRVWLLACKSEEELLMWKTAIIKAAKLRHRMQGGREDQKKKIKHLKRVSLSENIDFDAPPPMAPPSLPPPSDSEDSWPSTPDDSPPGTPPGSPPVSFRKKSRSSSRRSSRRFSQKSTASSRGSSRSRTISSLERFHAHRVQNMRPRISSIARVRAASRSGSRSRSSSRVGSSRLARRGSSTRSRTQSGLERFHELRMARMQNALHHAQSKSRLRARMSSQRLSSHDEDDDIIVVSEEGSSTSSSSSDEQQDIQPQVLLHHVPSARSFGAGSQSLRSEYVDLDEAI